MRRVACQARQLQGNMMQTGRNHAFENAAKLNFIGLLQREAKI